MKIKLKLKLLKYSVAQQICTPFCTSWKVISQKTWFKKMVLDFNTAYWIKMCYSENKNLLFNLRQRRQVQLKFFLVENLKQVVLVPSFAPPQTFLILVTNHLKEKKTFIWHKDLHLLRISLTSTQNLSIWKVQTT